MQKYEIQNLNIHDKYYTNAAKYYRENLDKIQKGVDLDEPPGLNQGRQVNKPTRKIMKVAAGYGSDDFLVSVKKQKKETDFKARWEKSKLKMEEWGDDVSKTFKKWFKKKPKKKKKKNIKNQEENDSDKIKEKKEESEDEIKIGEEPENEDEKKDKDSLKDSKMKEKFEKGFSDFKVGMRKFGDKLSLGWKKFSKKTKAFARKSKKYFEEEFNKDKSSNTNNESMAQNNIIDNPSSGMEAIQGPLVQKEQNQNDILNEDEKVKNTENKLEQENKDFEQNLPEEKIKTDTPSINENKEKESLNQSKENENNVKSPKKRKIGKFKKQEKQECIEEVQYL